MLAGMARPSPLDAESLQRALTELPAWSVRGGRLYRVLRFDNFVEAFGFMTRVALIAEAMEHHPDWSNSYGRVAIELQTHDVGAVTELDLALARKIDALLAE